MTDPTLIERLDALEAHIAHRDSTIDELNDVVVKQWAEIERLTARLERLDGRLEALEVRSDGPAEEEPPPPHY